MFVGFGGRRHETLLDIINLIFRLSIGRCSRSNVDTAALLNRIYFGVWQFVFATAAVDPRQQEAWSVRVVIYTVSSIRDQQLTQVPSVNGRMIPLSSACTDIRFDRG